MVTSKTKQLTSKTLFNKLHSTGQGLTYYDTSTTLNGPIKQRFRNISGKGENACYPCFLCVIVMFRHWTTYNYVV